MRRLSKSKYTTFCQCPKALWLKIYKPELEFIDEQQKTRFEQGTEVGNLARRLFGDYIDVTTYKNDSDLDLSAMIEKTSREIEKGTENICEASFSFENNRICNYCAVDMLHRESDGWSIYEVKSSSYTCDKDDTPKQLIAYIRDIAYQQWVLQNCGLKVKGAYLVRLNSNYMRDGELDINQLFHVKNMGKLVMDELNCVNENIRTASEILFGNEPDEKLDRHCKSPYDCGFMNYCMGELPEPNVFELYRMNFSKKCELYYKKKISFNDLRFEKLSDIQQMQVETYLNETQYINPKQIRGFLNELTYPLYFLDFETMQSAIPPYNKSKPYQQIAFQYSLHWIEEENGELKHTEFLGNSVDDPRRELAEQLCADIPFGACVMAYNKSFECSRIKEMSEIYPDLSEHLLMICNNIKDLIDPFRGRMVYLPAMNGSFSIKKVLPALFPNCPELNYQNLSGSVHHGGEAMNIYPAISKMSSEEADYARRSLLEYCKLDTLAMVRVWEKLKEYAQY